MNKLKLYDCKVVMLKHAIKDTLQKYVHCLFELKNVSIFRSSGYAKYGPPVDLSENIEWGKQYLGEYDICKNEYTSFPVLKKKSKTFTPILN